MNRVHKEMWKVFVIAAIITFGIISINSVAQSGCPCPPELPGQEKIVIQEGDHIINESGTVVSNKIIQMKDGGIVITADNVTLNNLRIEILNNDPTQDGITAIGVDNLKLLNIEVKKAQGNGIFIKNSRNNELLESKVKFIGGSAIVLDNVSDSNLIGWNLISKKNTVELINSNNNLVLSVRGRGFKEYGLLISPDSEGNQIVRSRFYGEVLSENENNLWHHTTCDIPNGFSGCHHTKKGAEPNEYNDPANFTPQIWTVCGKESFQHDSCDFNDLTLAINTAAEGDVLIIDSQTQEGDSWPAVSINKPLWLIGNTLTQKGTYHFDVILDGLTVTSPDVRLENLRLRGPFLIAEGTEIYNVAFREGKDWIPIDPKIVPEIEPELPPIGANLHVTKTSSINPVILGDNVTYTITITNNGPENATNVTAIDSLPIGVSLINALSSQGNCITLNSTVQCYLEKLPVGESALVEITVSVDNIGAVINTVTVSANEEDNDPDNNEASETNIVVQNVSSASNELYVADDRENLVYVYNKSGALINNFQLSNENGRPFGVATAENLVYVLDRAYERVYSYDSSGTFLQFSKTLKTGSGGPLGSVSGLAIDGNYLWVLDQSKNQVYSYSLADAFSGSGTISALQEIGLDTQTNPKNTHAGGLAIDSLYLYVLDYSDKVFYRYERTKTGGVGSAVFSRTMSQVNGDVLKTPSGASINGLSILIVDRSLKKVLEYGLIELFSGSGNLNAKSEFNLDQSNTLPQGI